jgi:hypothetical protein
VPVASPSLQSATNSPDGSGPLQVPRHRLTPKQDEANKFSPGPASTRPCSAALAAGKTFLFTRAVVARALRGRWQPPRRPPPARQRGARRHQSGHAAQGHAPVLPWGHHGRAPDGRLFRIPEQQSQIWVGGLDDKERVEKILGQEYATIFLNECSQIPYESVLVARTRLAQVRSKASANACTTTSTLRGNCHWSNCRVRSQRRSGQQATASQIRKTSTGCRSTRRDNQEPRRGLPRDPREHAGEAAPALSISASTSTRSTTRSGPTTGSTRSGWRLSELPPLRRIVVAVDPSGASWT